MKRKILTIILISLVVFGCSTSLRDIKCVTTESCMEAKSEVLNVVDSVISSTNEMCRKFKIVDYSCKTDSLLEVKVRTNCDDKYFIFDKNIKLLKVVTVLKEFN